MQAGGVRHANGWHSVLSSVEQLIATPVDPAGVFWSINPARRNDHDLTHAHAPTGSCALTVTPRAANKM